MMRFDLRAPSFGASASALYRSALDMAAWADRSGFELLRVSEHRGAEDGYCALEVGAGLPRPDPTDTVG